MDLTQVKIIPDTKLWPTLGVSKDKGRRDLKKLEEQGLVAPSHTPTGRFNLSFNDLLQVAKYYEIDPRTGASS